MKYWQFFMLLAAIYLAPVAVDKVNVGVATFFIVLGFAAMLKDR